MGIGGPILKNPTSMRTLIEYATAHR